MDPRHNSRTHCCTSQTFSQPLHHTTRNIGTSSGQYTLARLRRTRSGPAIEPCELHELRLLPAETEYDSGAIPEIVLPVIGAVGKLRQKILGLYRTDCKMARHRHINSAPSRCPKSCLRSQHNRIGRPDGPQK